MHAQSRRDWAGLEPSAIPTKTDVPQLAPFIAALPAAARVLDVGCGAGVVTRMLLTRELSVVGLDINAAAIAQLQRELPEQAFFERDVAAADGFRLAETGFDAAICQLVISVVGDAQDRARLLRNICAALTPGAPLFLSCSGLSADLNPEYEALYARDAPLTAEHGSYLSRDAHGRVLYRTHHFSEREIEQLLRDQSFGEIAITERIEASSRRPDQRARFYYVTCRRIT
jgi:SAM-dependent methyltransferase